MKNALILLACTLILNRSCAQNKANLISEFDLGGYRINPSKKKITEYTMVGGENWDGFTYKPLEKVNFSTTTMLVFRNYVWFKEQFPFKFDLESLEVFYQRGTQSLLRDKNYLYHFNSNLKDEDRKRISLVGYTRINDFVYRKSDGHAYYLSPVDFNLRQIDIPGIDLGSLEHISGNYFHDKQGLYVFGGHSYPGPEFKQVTKSELLQKSNSLNDKIFVRDQYFVFGNHVYGDQSNEQVQLLDIEADNMILGSNEDANIYFITDGKSLYEDANYFTADSKNQSYEVNAFLGSGVTIDCILKPNIRFIQKGADSSEIVIVSEDIDKEGYTFPEDNLIAKVNRSWYLLFAGDHDPTPIKISKLTIYNSETNKYEDLEEDQFTTFPKERFIRYKNTLYFDGMPVKTKGWDLTKLRYLEGSDFMTDGKMLFYTGGIGGMGIEEIKGKEYAVFDDRVMVDAFSTELKVVSEAILTDGEIIISGAQKIEIKDLKLNTKILYK